MKIYTRSGDDGTTGLFGGPRVTKDNARIEAYGTVDELNAAIGVALAEFSATAWECEDLAKVLAGVQHQLFHLGAELATRDPQDRGTDKLTDAHVAQLEQAIDAFEGYLPPLTAFILPAGEPTAAMLHLARCVARRAERRLVELSQVEPVRPLLIAYLNRLSDLLFVAARRVNQAAGRGDVAWDKDA